MQDSVTAPGPFELFRSDQVNFDSTWAAGEFESPGMDEVDLGRNLPKWSGEASNALDI